MFEPSRVYEVTIRTIQGRFLLRPSKEVNDIILGVIGRGLYWHPSIRIYGFVFLSNHATWLISSEHPEQIAGFFSFVNGNISRLIGRLHDWPGRLWERSHRPIPVVDDESLVSRMKYLLAQGCKEGLVTSPKQWPGASCVNALCRQHKLTGRWLNRDAWTKAAKRKGNAAVSKEGFSQEYEIPLTRIPCWSSLSSDAYASRIRALLRVIETEAEKSLKHLGGKVVGRQAILNMSPHHRPEKIAKSPAPLCHASSKTNRITFRTMYREFVNAFRAAAQKLKTGLHRVRFPLFSFPPRRPMLTSSA